MEHSGHQNKINVLETNISNHDLPLDFLVAEEVHVPLGRRHPRPWRGVESDLGREARDVPQTELRVEQVRPEGPRPA